MKTLFFLVSASNFGSLQKWWKAAKINVIASDRRTGSMTKLSRGDRLPHYEGGGRVEIASQSLAHRVAR